MRGRHLSIAIFAIFLFAAGLGLGVLVQYETTQSRTDSEGECRKEHNASSPGRIAVLQGALDKQAPATNLEELVQRVDAQMKIGELTIQSRSAAYSSLTPFTGLASSGLALLTALLGFLGGWFGKKHGADASTAGA